MSRSRLPIIIVLIISLLGVHVTRRWAIASRTPNTSSGGASAEGLSRLNSFALALMLGGLRGPLVMFLWPSAERQKNEKNLEDFDTKIEWIRLLQAEFDSVHIFQIWNKAYNISVQMANVGNKYLTILDALDYGRKVDAERPNDINIVTEIGRLFADKLGRSDEKAYYRQRVRDETRARVPMVRVTMPSKLRDEFEKQALAAGIPPPRLRYNIDETRDRISTLIPKTVADAIQPHIEQADVTFVPRASSANTGEGSQLRRRELDPILDADGNILPQFLVGKIARPANLPADSEWNDGSELQYLKAFEPFPYGVSTLALGFNYLKRAQVLQDVNKQKHVQLTDVIVDRAPPLTLREWAAEEWERGRRAEIQGFGLTAPSAVEKLESPTAETMPDASITYRSLIDEAIFSYTRAADVIDTADKEYRRTLVNDKSIYLIYVEHLDELAAQKQLILGDRDYLKLMVAPEKDQPALRNSARDHYRQAVIRYRTMLLKYHLPEEITAKVLPQGVTKTTIEDAKLDPEAIETAANAALALVNRDDINISLDVIDDFTSYIARANARIMNLGS